MSGRAWGVALLATAIVLSTGTFLSTNRALIQAQSVTTTPTQGPRGLTGVQGPAGSTTLTGTTGSIGGGLLTVGSCATGTATVTGAAVGMVASANPTTYQGDGVQFQAYVSAANTVTVKACALLLITPTASTYSVRVQQ